jgi:hypothetical protein
MGMTTIIETGHHVWEVTCLPDDPEPCGRMVTFKLLSGAPLTVEQADEATNRLVVDAMSRGINVVGWGYVEDQP